jgi:hypothetical protein
MTATLEAALREPKMWEIDESAGGNTAYVIQPISPGWRIAKAALPLAAGALVTWGLLANGYAIVGYAFAAVSLVVAWALFSETEKKSFAQRDGELTAAAKLEQARLELQDAAARTAREQQSTKRAGEFDDVISRWWIRYPLAVLVLFGAGFAASDPKLGWGLATLAFLLACYLARELALFALMLTLVYWGFTAFSALPVSAAILIGAWMIASAIKDR